MNPLVLTASLAAVALGSLGAAVFLTWHGDDATPAWASLTGAVGALLGQQAESPSEARRRG